MIVTSFFPWKIIRAITHEIDHVEKSFQVVISQYNNHGVIILEVTMTRQIFQKLINPEINQNYGVW